VLEGQLTLRSHQDFAPGLSEDTSISAFVSVSVTIDLLENDVLQAVVRSASGTGAYVQEADSGCGRPPEVDRGTAIGGSFRFGRSQATLDLSFSGTSTSTTCSEVFSTPFTGTLNDGELRGTPVFAADGSVAAIDFNRTTTNGSRATATTGLLIRVP
jgi:hypothetical protein